MTELVDRPASWTARVVRSRELSAVELFDAHAARVAERDPPSPSCARRRAGCRSAFN